MAYIEVINSLSFAINNLHEQTLFLNSLKELKEVYGIETTTDFLRSFVNGSNNRAKTNRIYFLLNSCGLKTERVLRYSKILDTARYKIDITEYARNKKDNAVFIKNIRCQEIAKQFLNRFHKVYFKVLV